MGINRIGSFHPPELAVRDGWLRNWDRDLPVKIFRFWSSKLVLEQPL